MTQEAINWQWNCHSNEGVRRRAEMEKISIVIKRRRWKWLGYILRMDNTRHAKIAISWIPDGKRKRGGFLISNNGSRHLPSSSLNCSFYTRLQKFSSGTIHSTQTNKQAFIVKTLAAQMPVVRIPFKADLSYLNREWQFLLLFPSLLEEYRAFNKSQFISFYFGLVPSVHVWNPRSFLTLSMVLKMWDHIT